MRKTMIEFEVTTNGIVWRNHSGRYLGWFTTWPEAIKIISTLRDDVKFRITTHLSPEQEIVFLPR